MIARAEVEAEQRLRQRLGGNESAVWPLTDDVAHYPNAALDCGSAAVVASIAAAAFASAALLLLRPLLLP